MRPLEPEPPSAVQVSVPVHMRILYLHVISTRTFLGLHIDAFSDVNFFLIIMMMIKVSSYH